MSDKPESSPGDFRVHRIGDCHGSVGQCVEILKFICGDCLWCRDNYDEQEYDLPS